MLLILLAIVVAMAVVAIGVAFSGGGMAVAAPGTDATIEATPFSVASGQIDGAYAVCPGQQRALGGGVVQSGGFVPGEVAASGPLAETKDAANTVSGDIAKRWYAWVVNFPYGGPMVNLKVFAICSSAPPGPGPAPGPGPTPPPKVISTVPTANAKGVSPTANITATFSKDMVDSSINPTTFKLFKKGTKAKLQAAVSYSAATDKATLDPTNSLQSGATYRALVTTGAKDLPGNPLDQKHKWFFTVS
jgi:hypothetical protein